MLRKDIHSNITIHVVHTIILSHIGIPTGLVPLQMGSDNGRLTSANPLYKDFL